MNGEKLYGLVMYWIAFVGVLLWMNLIIGFFIEIFLTLFSRKISKENCFVIYYNRFEDYLCKNMFTLMFYPLALIGKYFLGYVPVILVLLEYVFIFWLFKSPSVWDSEGIWTVLFFKGIGVLCTYKVTRFLLALYERGFQKLSSSLPIQEKSPLDQAGYIFSLFIIAGGLIAALLDENSFVSGLINWGRQGLDEMSFSMVFLLILVMAGITYGHITESWIKKEKATRLFLKKRQHHKRSRVRSAGILNPPKSQI